MLRPFLWHNMPHSHSHVDTLLPCQLSRRQVVLEGAAKADAEKAKEELAAAGAKVKIA